MRALTVGVLLALLAVPVFGDEPTTEPAPAAEKPPPPPLSLRSIEIPRPGTALAPGANDEEVWVATDDGAVLRVAIDGGVTRGSAIGLAGIEALVDWSEGDRLAVATPTEMIVLRAESGEELWRAERPIAFDFDPSRRSLVSVSATGEVLERDATTGNLTGRRLVAEKRAVVRASLHAYAGRAVLGVADGANLDCLLVELNSGWVRYEFSGPPAEQWYAAFLPGGREFLASRPSSSGVGAWPTEAGDEERTPPEPTTAIESLPGTPTSVVVSTHRHVAIALEGGAVVLRRLSGAAPSLAPLPGEGPSLVTFTPSGRHVVALRGGRLFAWAIPGLDPPAKVLTPARAAARRDVLSAALEACCGKSAGRVFVVDETLRSGRGFRANAAHIPAERAKDAVVLPDGSWALPPQIEGLTLPLFEDWLAQRAPSPAPRELKASRPIEWLSADGFAALMPRRDAQVTPRTTEVTPPIGEEDVPLPDPWMRHFHARFPGANAWIRFSDVGFSPSLDQALVLVSWVGDWSTSIRWYFLRRQGGRWAVVAERLSVISCR